MLRGYYLVLFYLLAISLLGCKGGVQITEGPRSPSVLQPDVDKVIISIPANSTHYSNGNTLTISGLCTDDYTVVLTGNSNQTALCANSEFSFVVSASIDGVYNYFIHQFYYGTKSDPIPQTWIRKTSISPPHLQSPTTTTYYSSSTVLTLSGYCENGSTIILTQDGIGEVECVNSMFNLDVYKFIDGTYNIGIKQTDLAGNEASVNLVWVKAALTVTPSSPQIIAGKNQVFTISGGSHSYTSQILQNNSGASYDNATNTYTAGTLSKVVDKVKFTDSLGASVEVDISVVSDIADHFEYPSPSGNSQLANYGDLFTNPIRAKVVDQYGNPVSSFPVIFQVTGGSLGFIDSITQSTDINGIVTMNLVPGIFSTKSRVTVLPYIMILPDLAATGKTKLDFELSSKSKNNGEFGLVYNVGVNPEELILKDINNDSINDLIVLNTSDPSISILLGKGDGFYKTQTKITNICTSPTGMVVDDFNENNHIDIIVTCIGPDKISFYSGMGDGTFLTPAHTTLTAGETNPVSIIAADFNLDSHKDIVISLAGSDSISIRGGVGNGTFSVPVLYSVGSIPINIVSAQFDNQTGPDLAVLNAGSDSITILLNNGSGAFPITSDIYTGLAPSDLVAEDFDKDGFKDIIATSSSENNISIFLNDQLGNFMPPNTANVGQSPSSIATGDLNLDSNLDLIITNGIDNTLSILNGLGNGSFQDKPTYPVLSNPVNSIVADVNSDSIPDIISLSGGDSKIQVILTQIGGELGLINDTGVAPKAVKIFDYNKDGFEDQVIANSGDNTISFLRGNGKGVFSPGITLSTTAGPSALDHGDFNSDGNEDLVVVNQGVNTVQIFLGTSGGNFGTPTSYPVGSFPEDVIISDFNHDGKLDFVTANGGDNNLSYFPGIGDGTFGTRSNLNTDAQPKSLALADINEDGNIDILTANSAAGTVNIFLSNGDGTFQNRTSYEAQVGPSSIVAGFFNSDSFIDIAVSNVLSSSVSIFFGRPDFTYGTAVNYSAGSNASSLQVSDLNGDGFVDFIVTNGVSRSLTLMFGNFIGNFSNTKTLLTNRDALKVQLCEVNKDGAVDLILIDSTNPKTELLLGVSP